MVRFPQAPKELVRRSLLSASLIAHVLIAKYVLGVPFARQESLYQLMGEGLDRSTMCRYAEDIGATLGAVVDAMAHEAKTTAFCLSTDATGVAIQPTFIGDGKRQPCRKGHFFVVLADKDHVFFEYQPKHTSKAVSEMFRGFHGYIQADANAVYDALFRGGTSVTLWNEEPQDPPPKEVGCYSHCRRNFWDAAVCKHPEGLTGMKMIDALFESDAPLWKLPPSQRQLQRHKILLPMVNAFFDWVREESKKQRPRGLVSKALGYAFRQEAPLRRFLEDPRLKLDNNGAERAIRPIATGRKNWLFFGSDDHAQAAANLFSLWLPASSMGSTPSCTWLNSSGSCPTGPGSDTSSCVPAIGSQPERDSIPGGSSCPSGTSRCRRLPRNSTSLRAPLLRSTGANVHHEKGRRNGAYSCNDYPPNGFWSKRQGTSKHCINAPGYQAAIGLLSVPRLDSKFPD